MSIFEPPVAILHGLLERGTHPIQDPRRGDHVVRPQAEVADGGLRVGVSEQVADHFEEAVSRPMATVHEHVTARP